MKRDYASINLFIRDKNILSLSEYLKTLSAFEIAVAIANKSDEDQLLVFMALSPELAADTYDYLPLRAQKKIIYSLPSTYTANILKAMSPDDRTALLQKLPRTVVDEYVKLLSNQERILTLSLLDYPEASVGRIMTTDYIAVKINWTVENVLNHIRDYGHDSETINVIYVVDDSDKLIDDIKIKEFLFVPKEYKVAQISDFKFVALSVYEKAENVIQVFEEHDRVALPVVDNEGLLLGIVTIDDILRLASEKATENMQKVGGMEALDEPYMDTPFFELMKKRARWLVLLFIGEMFTATAMGFFEAEISKAIVLALFLPLIISSGGNAGSQSSTLIIRAMALGEVKLKDWWKVMKREVYSGLFLGLVLAIIGFVRVMVWGTLTHLYGEHWFLIAFTIFFALIGVVLWGSLSGSMLPLLLRKAGFDPATSSAPLVATMVDVVGIIIYFSLAMLILQNTLL